MERQRQRQVRSRTRREVDVGMPGERRRPRIDDDQARAGALRFANVRDEMNARGGRDSRPRGR